jgi:hypothetical protein
MFKKSYIFSPNKIVFASIFAPPTVLPTCLEASVLVGCLVRSIDEESSDGAAVTVQRVDGQPLLQAEHAQRVVLRPYACVQGLAMQQQSCSKVSHAGKTEL